MQLNQTMASYEKCLSHLRVWLNYQKHNFFEKFYIARYIVFMCNLLFWLWFKIILGSQLHDAFVCACRKLHRSWYILVTRVFHVFRTVLSWSNVSWWIWFLESYVFEKQNIFRPFNFSHFIFIKWSCSMYYQHINK